jgi:hypothetical protein
MKQGTQRITRPAVRRKVTPPDSGEVTRGTEGTATFLVTYTVKKTVTVFGESFHANPGEDLFGQAALSGCVEDVRDVQLVGWTPSSKTKRARKAGS